MVKTSLIRAGLDEFITEYEVGFYSIDEALPKLRLALEVDGCYWHGCSTCGFPGVKDIRLYDVRKTTYLENRGWSILRLLEHDMHNNWGDCLTRVRQAVVKAQGAV